jgi:hypothetical protein
LDMGDGVLDTGDEVYENIGVLKVGSEEYKRPSELLQ